MFLALFASVIGIAEQNDACMLGSAHGLNLSWWLVVNFVIVFLMLEPVKCSSCSAKWLVYFETLCLCLLMLPWQVVGIVIAATSQAACFNTSHTVGVAFAVIEAYELLGLALIGYKIIDPVLKPLHEKPAKLECFKFSVWILVLITAVAIALISFGATNLNDPCLVSDPTGLNLAQWEIIAGGAALVMVFVAAIMALCGRVPVSIEATQAGEVIDFRKRLWFREQMDKYIVYLAVTWIAFLIIWIPYGIFLVADTQRQCINSPVGAGQSSLTSGFVLCVLVLPLSAFGIVNHYTTSFWKPGLLEGYVFRNPRSHIQYTGLPPPGYES